MVKKEQMSSLSKISLKRRLWLAFVFSTFFPAALAFHYLTSLSVLPFPVVFVIALLSLVGWWFVLDVFRAVMRIHEKSKEALGGFKEISGDGEVRNEVEKLDAIFNTLSSKVKESMEELKEVGHKTEELNKTITQKVNVFSTILQANILFSKGANDEIISFFTERLKPIMEASVVVSVIQKDNREKPVLFSCGIDNSRVYQAAEILHSHSFFKNRDRQVLDKKHKNDSVAFLKDVLTAGNIMVNPVYIKDQVVGFIIVANSKDDFVFSPDDCQIAELFSRNMGIVLEHQLLSKRVEDLEIKDPLTGIYNERFFFARLEEEINRAAVYQRPCGLLVMGISGYSGGQHKIGMIELEKILKKIVNIFKDNIRPIDIMGRIKENKIGVILIERSKRQSQFLGLQLKEAVAEQLKEEVSMAELSVSFAVAENPIDGTVSEQLLECVLSRLENNEV